MVGCRVVVWVVEGEREGTFLGTSGPAKYVQTRVLDFNCITHTRAHVHMYTCAPAQTGARTHAYTHILTDAGRACLCYRYQHWQLRESAVLGHWRGVKELRALFCTPKQDVRKDARFSTDKPCLPVDITWHALASFQHASMCACARVLSD